jgi:hypothetical protein
MTDMDSFSYRKILLSNPSEQGTLLSKSGYFFKLSNKSITKVASYLSIQSSTSNNYSRTRCFCIGCSG